VLAIPLAIFMLADRDARKHFATPGPYIALAAAIAMMAPHLVWLVANDFLPFGYAEHRAVLSRGWYDHLWHPFQFAISQLFFLIPSLADRAAAILAAPRGERAAVAMGADAFDMRHRHPAAGLRADGRGVGAVGHQRPRTPSRCGAIRSSCSSVFGWC